MLANRAQPALRNRLRAQAAVTPYGLTVFRSPRISRFPIHIVSNLPNEGISGLDLILARASGRLIDHYGGVPSGASGSPVYWQGRLLGAISASFYPDSSLVGLTPRAAMLTLAEERGTPPGETPGAAAAPSPARATCVGLTSGRALGEVTNRFGPPLIGSDSHVLRVQQGAKLQPGSPIGAALLIGDIKLGFIGTATIVNREAVYAFGHPLLYSGPTSLALTEATIADTAIGDQPNKVGTFGPVIGTVLQDRAAGIYARLAMQPAMIPLKCTIRDEDRERIEIVQTSAAPLPAELSFLTYITAAESMQRAMNRVGPGTSFWDWSLSVAGSDQPVQISGGTYDAYDIGSVVAAAVLPTLDQLLQAGTTILSINLTATVTRRKLPGVDDEA